MKVGFVDLNAIDPKINDEIKSAKAKVDEHRQYINGPEKKAFEESFAEFCGVRHCIGVDSGTSALELALRALKVGPGDEVITAANTYYATVAAIANVGAEPVLVDMNICTYNMEPALVREAITPRTKVILPVHLYGQPADMDELEVVALEYNLPILEDACQAHGAKYKGKRCGSMGDIAAFSFYPGKNLGSHGDGGAVVTSNPELADYVRALHDLGQRSKNVHDVVTGNHRLDTLQAAVLNVKLKHLDEWNSMRMANAQAYGEALSGISQISLPTAARERTHIYHLYVIAAEDRDGLRRHLDAAGIQTGIHYPTPIHQQPAFKYLGYPDGEFVFTETAAKRILSLPMFPELTKDQISYVASQIRAFYEGKQG